ncbi:MAG: RnfABCDGE type electron transport complex subunit B [Coriobacteriia bacterium]|nr:RnfABCDGE type electron transport complex subunit B [Coriobacteriia bacterium]
MLIAKAMGALAVIGLGTSAVLATAAKRFHVEVDPRVEAVAAALPGSNCGACGNASCFAAAEGIAMGEKPVNSCVAGGQKVADAIALIIGAESCVAVAVISARHCGGGTNAVRAYTYVGVMSCAAANRLAGGPLACAAGCIGFGDCQRACPFGAISMDERGLPVIDVHRCTGCGICVKECPRGQISLLELVPEAAPVVVRCNAHDKVKGRKANCSMCCIACKKCERECPSDAIHVIDMLAVVDYEKCTGCGTCVEVCPQKCIDLYGRDSAIDVKAADGAGPGTTAELAEPAEPVEVGA